MPFAAGCTGSQGMERGSAGADVAACPTADSTLAVRTRSLQAGGGARHDEAMRDTSPPVAKRLRVEIVNIAFRKLGVGTADAIFQIS